MKKPGEGATSDAAGAVRRPQNLYAHYHAHVYFDAATLEQARLLCQQAASTFGVAMGRVHQRRVGPHPRWSCQLTFDAQRFDPLVAWLDAHRDGLSVLVHPNTGDALADHTAHASWLGTPVELDLSPFLSKAGKS